MTRAKAWIVGSRALVTGAGGGIGRATAVALAERGAAVAAVDIDAESAETTATACGPGATAHVADVRDRDALAGLLDELGEIDIVGNNAGVGMGGRLTDMSAEDWEWIRGINLDGVVNGCAVFGPPMLERGRGHMVNLSSGLGYTPVATMPAYCTTKAAVFMLSQCLRADWAAYGVGVTAVCPGVINTPIVGRARFVGEHVAEEQRKVEKLFGKGHKPETVATAIIKAIEGDRPVALAGWEAKLGWGMHRFAPLKVQEAMARRGLR